MTDKKMKTLVVGDIHGHKDSVEAALAFDGDVVFVGDYLDSFTKTPEEQVECMTMVMDAVDAEPERVTGLLGNHELSYLVPEMRCSGWKSETQGYVTHLAERMKKTLKDYVWVNKVLVSHAGVSDGLLVQRAITLDEYLEKGDFNQIGRVRGGYDFQGGLYWNDFNGEMTPVPHLTQVVGHSNYAFKEDGEGVRLLEENYGKVYCVDNLSRKREGALIHEDGSVTPQEF